jgi:hypothetical protein
LLLKLPDIEDGCEVDELNMVCNKRAHCPYSLNDLLNSNLTLLLVHNYCDYSQCSNGKAI